LEQQKLREEGGQLKQKRKPWKHVYCERLIVERNWRKGRCEIRTLKVGFPVPGNVRRLGAVVADIWHRCLDQGHTNGVMCLQFHQNLPTASPSYPVLITGSYDRTARVWNLETGECVRTLTGHTRAIRALQFDGMMLITGSMDRTLRM
jgi:F-box/WD-40 domain protein MET30